MLTVYRRIFDLLTPRGRRLFWALMALMILAAFAEIAGLSVFFLLLRILAEPELIAQNEMLDGLYERMGFVSIFSFQVALSLAVGGVVLLSLIIKAASSIAMIRYAAFTGHAISWRLLKGYLGQPYAWSLDKKTAELSKNVLTDSIQIAIGVALPSLKIIANILLAGSILLFLVVQDPAVAAVSFLLLGGGYAGIYLLVRARLARLGEGGLRANQARFELAYEAVNGLKDVKLLHLEDGYMERFKRPSFDRAMHISRIQFLSDAPRFALEALTFFVLLGLVLFLLFRSDGNMAATIPTLGIFAYAVIRMLPALQQVYYNLASLRTGRPLLDLIHGNFTAVSDAIDLSNTDADIDPLPLEKRILFEDVDYSYPTSKTSAVKGLSLEIPVNATVGVVGGTGAGKTTFVDLILGLLSREAGRIAIDETDLTAQTERAWQKSVGYVPQQIFLTNSSLESNIAFGIPPEKIDHDAVIRAAKIAALHDFVLGELPEGYKTNVGERGVRLSGGQRQRIGIARALYHDPAVLIMDEATSALDTITEAAVMDAVQNLRNQKTIILVAHRLSTVQDCDTIFVMEKGRVVASGTYDDLTRNSDTFRRMVKAGTDRNRTRRSA